MPGETPYDCTCVLLTTEGGDGDLSVHLAALFCSEAEARQVYDSVLAHDQLRCKSLVAFAWQGGWRTVDEQSYVFSIRRAFDDNPHLQDRILCCLIRATHHYCEVLQGRARPGVAWWVIENQFVSAKSIADLEVSILTHGPNAATAGVGPLLGPQSGPC